MKKSVIIIALSIGVSSIFAQDLTSKKGEPILPEAEDWAISFDATPVFQYLGNAFNRGGNNGAPALNFLNSNQTIIGKKFINEKSAYRALLRLGFTTQTFKHMVSSDAALGQTFIFPVQAPKVEDKYKHTSTNIAIGVGKEYRRGKTRLQGYYGADAMIWLSNSVDKMTYGNKMAATAVSSASGASTTDIPMSTTWQTNTDSANWGQAITETATKNRITQVKSGMTFGIGVRGFLGIEYFIFPKISLGAEFGWGIGYQMTGKGKTKSQEQGGSPNQVAEIVRSTDSSSKFGFDTDLNQGTIFGFHGSNSGTGSIRATFHF